MKQTGTIIIPSIGKDWMIVNLLNNITQINDQLIEKIVILDNGMPEGIYQTCASYAKVDIVHAHGMGIYAMWNLGLAKAKGSDFAFILNDDLVLDTNNPSWFTMLAAPLFANDDIWATCPNYNTDWHPNVGGGFKEVQGTYKDHGFSGFCFAVKMSAYFEGLPLFDQNYYWWYGDDDFVHSVHRYGKKTVLVTDVFMHHIHGGSQTIVQYTPEFNEKVAKDREYYLEKWHNG